MRSETVRPRPVGDEDVVRIARAAWPRATARVRSLARAAVALGYVMALVAVPASSLAASPGPTGAVTGDPRSSGQSPGLVGDPLTAILVVVAIAALTMLATLLYVRATGGPEHRRGR